MMHLSDDMPGLLRRLLVPFMLLFVFSGPLHGQISMTAPVAWKIKDSKCTMEVKKIANLRSTTTGTLRLCLWVTADPVPNYGYRVATYQLDQLPPNYAYNNLKVSTSCNVKGITGLYHFSVVVEEYTHSGWKRVDYRGTGVKQLKNGSISNPKLWKIPKHRIAPPLDELPEGRYFSFKVVATEGLNFVPKGTNIGLKFLIEDTGVTRAFGGSAPPEGRIVEYRYSKTTGVHHGQTVNTGRLYLDYGKHFIPRGITSYSDMKLFFKNATSGYLQSKDVDPGGGGNSWSTFKITKK
jgi:hypothetical protein